MDIVLASDIGGTNTRVSAVGNDGTIIASSRRPTASAGSPEDIVKEIAELAADCSLQVRDKGKPAAFGLAMPALVDVPNGRIIEAPNLPQLDGVAFAGMIEAAVNIPVVLENDANAAAVGEAWLGASKGVATSICVTLGTGVGGGLILDGQLWRGIDGTAGEIGHICVEPKGVPCGCGSVGCLEQYASASAVVRMARELKENYPGSVLAGRDSLASVDVFDAAEKGDALGLEVFRLVGMYLGIGLADLINILNPEAIVIAGGAAAGWEMFIGHVRDEIGRRAFQRPAGRAKLVRAALGDTAGILGSARLALDSAARA